VIQKNKISVSAINSWLYYLQSPKDSSRLAQIVTSVYGVFVSNKWTRRGQLFEKEVAEGKHGKLSEVVKGLPKSVWCSKYITVDGIDLKLSGKLDVINKDKKAIYDIKRKNSFNEEDFDDDHTTQHTIYFYLNPWATDFYYLVASGLEDTDIEIHIVNKKRPDSEEELENKVFDYIHRYFEFLKSKDLFDLYLKRQVTKGQKNRRAYE